MVAVGERLDRWDPKVLGGILSARSTDEARRDQVDGWLRASFDELTGQQFLYDTQAIDALLKPLWSCLALYGDGGLSYESQAVLFKLLAHESYSRPETWQVAISLMIRTESMCAKAADKARGQKRERWRWYRVFLLDHAANRLVKPEQAADRAQLNQRAELLLTATLRQPSPATPLAAEDAPLLLRAAHYWGHRGNFVLREIQEGAGKKHLPLEPLLKDGVTFFERAISLRLVAYRVLRGAPLAQVFPLLEEWDSLKTTAAFDLSKHHIERLRTDPQGISDLANQFAALACLRCHEYALTKEQQPAPLLDALTLCDGLWREANRRVRNSHGRYYRTLRWRRLTEHMLYGVKNPRLRERAKPLHYYEDPLDRETARVLHEFQERRPWST